MSAPISFLSDYGLADEFVGVCHAVIATICPDAQVIDITHGIPRHDVRAGAFQGRSLFANSTQREVKPARGCCYSPGWSRLWLLTEDEMSAAILLPAGFSVLGARRPFLAVADGLDGAGWNARGSPAPA